MLLLDNNLSPKLCQHLEAVFPGNQHVEDINLDNSPDQDVWNYAKENGFAILTKDSDFNHLAQLYGSPPKVIWLRCGNVSTSRILALLLFHKKEIINFLNDSKSGLLEVY